MTNNTNDDDIKSKLNYIGLDLENIPDFLKMEKVINYKPIKNLEENTYKVYKYIPVSKIKIMLTPANRLNTITEKYSKADAISSYLDSENADNVEKFTTFLKMLKNVNINEIEDLEVQQKKLKKQIPFLVKFSTNYLWQIYYEDISDTYFMLVPTEDLDYAAFFYLLKKQINLNQFNKEEWIYVPISYVDYSGDYLKKSQISDLEKYIWQFTKKWPITYEVYDKDNNMSIQIVGNAQVYENIESEYKIRLKTKEEAEKFYKLMKALFILSVELPHYYHFEMKVNYFGSLECTYNKKKITYDTLMELLMTEYEKIKKQIFELAEQKEKQEKYLEKLKDECTKKEQEYLIKEKQIATYLECRKTFFGKVTYFFKSKKLKKDLKHNKNEEQKENEVEQQEVASNREIEFSNKEYYTIEDIIKISKELDDALQVEKNLKLDTDAQERKVQSIAKKIENANLYIEEIDKHEKSIFEFWKFANKDEQALLQEATNIDIKQDKKMEKVFDYEDDIEEIGTLIDKKQRSCLKKEETDAIYIATTELLDVLNNYENDKLFAKSLEDIKKEAENARVLFNQENFDLFGNVEQDSTKIQLIGGKKHREAKKDKLKILEVNKNLSLEEYKDKMLEILNNIYKAFEKCTSSVSIPIYYATADDFSEVPMQVFSIKPEEAMEQYSEEKELNLYRLNVKENMPVIYFTNSIYYDNYNKTLPLGMEVSKKCLIKLSDYDLELKNKEDFRITKLEDDFKAGTIKINVFEYDIKKRC